MSRKAVMAGNWKMHLTRTESAQLIQGIITELDGFEEVETVIFPPFTALSEASELLKNSTLGLGAQNVHWESSGAFTGEISVHQLLDCGCRYVLIGHSERRQYFNELNLYVHRKLKSVLKTELTPILCVGESLDDRLKNRVEDVVLGELEQAVDGLTEKDLFRMIIAYEPVWAIGTGETATPEVAEEVHHMIREWLSEVYSAELSAAIRILYGGSVKPDNIAELMSQPDIDGALVGGASLTAESFSRIVRY